MHNNESRYDECRVLFIIMLNVVMISVVMPIVGTMTLSIKFK
jgi:hypothetical protein